MSKANLQSCYEKVNGLADHVQELQQPFNYCIKGLVDSTQIDLKQVPKTAKPSSQPFSNFLWLILIQNMSVWSFQLMENIEYTFELLVRKALEDPSVSLSMAMQKASNRVLKVSISFSFISTDGCVRLLNLICLCPTAIWLWQQHSEEEDLAGGFDQHHSTQHQEAPGPILQRGTYEISCIMIDKQLSKYKKWKISYIYHWWFISSNKCVFSQNVLLGTTQIWAIHICWLYKLHSCGKRVWGYYPGDTGKRRQHG